ncbi:FtsH-binding integral membrane protein [Nocardioides sp. BE266]|uniref:hypothetical protein n=1 Tax=Nocardioides sp. BE266 TaxID=2817725 RepID=UPI002864A4A6|nr:hypothetical protein [Nocardioides sp. BE266]MDR7252691.1 FtsH-binding integral membrane protein [Nocardioides sp. BE266]
MGTLAPWRRVQDLGNDVPHAPGSQPRAALELRVHGVHGTSPASMLGVKDPRQVAGDGITGVFRAGGELPRRELRPGHAVEAYSWGALTSAVRGALGWVQRVLWLGLLPFALVNLAYWARLHVGTDTRTGRWGAGAVRWAALLLTMLIVLTTCLISLDLVAWQCYRGGTKSCDVLPDRLDFMMILAPSQRLAVASLVPLAAIGLMWFLSRQTLARYEASTDPYELGRARAERDAAERARAARAAEQASVPTPASGPTAAPAGTPAADERSRLRRFWAWVMGDGEVEQVRDAHLLQLARFWSSTRRTVRLQAIHLAAAVATLMAYLGVQQWKVTGHPNPWAVAGFAILLTCFVAAARLHPQDVEYFGPRVDEKGPHDVWAPWLMRLSVVLVLTQLAWLASPSVAERSRVDWNSGIGWWGHNLWFIGTFVALSAVNIAVFAAGRMKPRGAIATIALFVIAVIVAAWVSVRREGVTERVEVALLLGGALLLAIGFFVWMLRWQWRQARPSRRLWAKAWYGGAPAVLIGAAGWIALLFTTAAVTAAAEYLNGPDQSVSDLTSDWETVRDSTAPTNATAGARDDTIRLSEGAVLRDGIVVLPSSPQRPAQLVRGVIVVDRAEVLAAVDLTKPLRDTVVYSGVLGLEDTTLEVIDTCWVASSMDPPPSCHPDTDQFESAAEVPVKSQELVVAPGGRIRLAVADPPTTPLVVPQVLIWAPIVQVLWALLAALVAAGCFIQLKARVYGRIKLLAHLDGVPTESRNEIRRKRLRAAYAHRAERLLELLGGVTVASVLLLLCLSATGMPPNVLVSTLLPDWRSDLPHLLASVSLYVVLGLSAGFVLLSSYVRRSEATRKAVGILWDLTTFWPRAAHPLSPPCYAERVVPELSTRIRWARQHGASVVVSGHSQGSLIAAATLIRLDEEELKGVTFVTYGSQLRALYGRVFPCVLGPDVLGYDPTDGAPKFNDPRPDAPRLLTTYHPHPPGKEPRTLWDLLGEDGWYNFFRRADPLGWRVFSDEDSTHDVVTPEVPPRRAGDPGPTVATHSGYQHTAEYRGVVCTWLRETLVEEADWEIGQVKPLPEP